MSKTVVTPVFETRGEAVKVKVAARGADDTHAEITILIEDDGTWHKKLSISSHYLDEFIDELNSARDFLEEKAESDEFGYGWSLIPFCQACNEYPVARGVSNKRDLCEFCLGEELNAVEEVDL